MTPSVRTLKGSKTKGFRGSPLLCPRGSNARGFSSIEQAMRYAVILMDYADETKQDYDELLIERNRNSGYWLHFAVRTKDNRRKTMFIQK